MRIKYPLIALLTLLTLVGCGNKPQENVENVQTAVSTESTQDVVSQESSKPTTETSNQATPDISSPVTIVTPQGSAYVHFIATGNSDAILIQSGDEAMLIDGADNNDEATLVAYLTNVGVTELKYVVASHAHADHVGALDSVISKIPTEHVLVSNGSAETETYRDFINAATNAGLKPSVPLEDVTYTLGESEFWFYNAKSLHTDTNDQSLVIYFEHGDNSLILTGDAEAAVEHELLDVIPTADILKLGHHGSRSSSSEAFLDTVSPDVAVITCGEGNKYSHPHPESLERVKARDIELHRTDECGDVIFELTGKAINYNCPVGSYLSPDNTSQAEDTTKVPHTELTPEASDQTVDTVYWTPNGEVYHTTKTCSSLSRSKTILDGTTGESGKSRVCERCK